MACTVCQSTGLADGPLSAASCSVPPDSLQSANNKIIIYTINVITPEDHTNYYVVLEWDRAVAVGYAVGWLDQGRPTLGGATLAQPAACSRSRRKNLTNFIMFYTKFRHSKTN